MPEKAEIIKILKNTGFSCSMCGECCTNRSDDSNLVLVSATEIREIIKATGLLWDDIAEPYPESFTKDGCEVTFAWCLKRDQDICIFLGEDKKCRIYKSRPWICRTYPFMLTEDDLIISECKNTGFLISDEEAAIQASGLTERKEREDMEYNIISRIFSCADLKGIKSCVIDSEGVKRVG